MSNDLGSDGLTLQERQWYTRIETAREAYLAAKARTDDASNAVSACRDDLPNELLADLRDGTLNVSDLDDETSEAVAELKAAELRLDLRRKESKAAAEELREVVLAGPSPQQMLDFDAVEPSNDWRTLPIEELGLPVKHTAALREAGITTIGQLSPRVNVVGWYKDVAGIGPKAAEEIELEFVEFWRDHPEYTE